MDADIAGRYAAFLSLVEVGLGSVLHAFRIPFTGHFLSLNQGFFLARASHQTGNRTIGASISNVTAILKSLSPAGKKLTPMLAISAQGLWFSLGTGLFGVNFVGVSFGMTLLSLWAFIQPLLIYSLFYGKTLLTVADYYLQKIHDRFEIAPEQLLYFVLLLAGIKVALAILVGWFALFAREEKLQAYESKMVQLGRSSRRPGNSRPAASKSPAWLLAARDLLNPFFLGSLLFTAVFLFQAESSQATLVWTLLRPIAVAFILFWIIRVIPLERMASRVRGPFGARLITALRTVRDLTGR